MAAGGEDVSALDNKAAVEVGSRATSSENEHERLESLLLDGADQGQALEHIAAHEVRVVNGQSAGRLGLLLGLLLISILLLGAGYYYVFNSQIFKPQLTQVPLDVSPRLPIPARPTIDLPVAAVTEDTPLAKPKKEVSEVAPAVIDDVSLFTVMVGPLIDNNELEQASSQLRELGLSPEEKKGRGQVVMIRLLQGIYPAEEARGQLSSLKKVVKSAFVLPEGDKLAVYAGSFHQQDRAKRMQDQLALKKVDVSLVESEIAMDGTMLIALQADEKTAREVAAHISNFGLQTQVLETK
jgi:hypothetical protein